MIRSIFLGLLPVARLGSEAPTQLAGEGCPAQRCPQHTEQRWSVWLPWGNCVPVSTAWFCPHLPLGIAGESIFLSVITLICGTRTLQFSEG